ncbi:MAG TPA: protein translocase subunit SecD [Actinomycetota bacterium]
MAASASRYWRSLIMIVLIVGAVWGGGYLAHNGKRAQAERDGVEAPGLVNLGLDLQGGISVVLSPAEGQAVQEGSLEKARDIIEQRVNGLGVAEPEISIEGSNIAVQLPGVTRATQALELIGTTAKLSFRPVLGEIPPPAAGVEPEPGLPDCSDPNTYPEDDPSQEVMLCARATVPQTGEEIDRALWSMLRLGPAALGGDEVSGARAEIDPQGVQGWSVALDLTGEGSQKFAEITGDLACKRDAGDPGGGRLAVVLDKVVESSPTMGEGVNCGTGITGGTATISGSFTQRDASDLAQVLQYGALPVELEPATTTTVSPTLGRDSLRGGLTAGALGLAIVLIYVLVFYRALGMVIWLGLVFHGLFTMGIIVLLGNTVGFTLTLAGIAGLIVSLGIAVDSFIVYFERIKDEARHGKSARASVDRAWTSAWRTIVAADLVTALAAVILYLLAVGSVRGFALMLGLATSLDIFISRLYMHPAVWLLAQKRLSTSKTLGVRGSPALEAGA